VQRESGPISEEEEELARTMLYDYYSKLEAVDKSLIVGVEYEFELYIAGVKIVGIIDRSAYVDNTKKVLTISDYKSGRSSITQAQAKDNLQMAIYTMAAIQTWPAERYITELIYPRLNKSVKHEFTKEELEKHIEDIRKTGLSIKLDKRFKPEGTPPRCGYCGFNTICGTGKFQNRIWQGILKKRQAKSNG
jgi:CRISPR/Cas system-associated exonuclease Cas4 (RecB family)